MKNSIYSLVSIVLLALLAISPTNTFAAGKTHHVAIHIDDSDPARMNMALNNAQNVSKYYESVGDEVVIEIVAYGPGLNMLVEGKSPVKTRISAMSLEISKLQFSACGNTLHKMSEKTGTEIKLLSEATIVPSGVVRLIELQEKGFSYVRP